MIDLLRELCEADGIPGDEGAVRNLILTRVRDHVDEITIDPMGNLLVVKRGTGQVNLRVMAAAHMDEVGMILMGFETDGTLRFGAVGGLDHRILPGTRVRIGADKIPGVVMWMPIHNNKGDETVPIDRLRIDIGASSKESAQKYVERGDSITFDSPFVDLGPTVRGKAFDDRAGCASLINLIQGDPFPFDLYAAFTVQEEVGLRGAKIAGQRWQPDMAFVLETTACHDLPQDPDEPDQTTITTLGAGPAITVADGTTISNPRLVQYLVRTAAREGIPCQFRSTQHAGGTDAGTIHKTGIGVPSVTVATPCRYLHGPNLIMSVSDWENQSNLIRAAWLVLDEHVISHQ